MLHSIKSLWFLAIAALLTGTLGFDGTAHASAPVAKTYAVVVNTGNKAKFKDDAAAKKEIKQLFLKNSTAWSTKDEAKPFAVKDEAQDAFRDKVLGMSKAELERHWISMKNKKGITPPKEVSSTKMLTKYIGKYVGGFGVLPEAEAKSSGLKILFTFSG